MKQIRYIGLDMDHTLVRYHSENFESLAYRTMLEKLVVEKGYPASVRKLKFDFQRAIRGLVIDKFGGNLLKLSRYGAIRQSQHGTRPVDFATQKQLYRSTYIDLGDPKYDAVDTQFSISFATLFAQLVDLKDQADGHKWPDYHQLATDLNYVLDKAHRDGSIKNVVRENLKDFVIQDPETVAGLERYKKHDKRIFVLTNSEFFYTKLLLDYTINPYLKEHASWSELFDFVITGAQKPRFFYDNLKFLRIDPSNGSMTNVDGKITPGIYQAGGARQMTADLDLAPDQILYIGDHIYGDIVRLKKDCAWRTALVVEEIEAEIRSAVKATDLVREINELMAKKRPLETEIDRLISSRIESEREEQDPSVTQLIDQVTKIDQKISPLIRQQQTLFNSHWGEVMRTGIEESYFAYQVERFACIYMAKLKDFLKISPRSYYRSQKRPMPHEFD
jgi:HAD superfamily 5'-nucleotidase-like hydrolase